MIKRILLLFLLTPAGFADTVVGDFRLSVVTDEAPGARQMAETESGLLLVGSLRQGNLYAVTTGADGMVEVVTFARRLELPSGLALIGDDLYVGALDRVLRYRSIEKTFRDNPEPEIVTDILPDERHHGWKYLSVGPDGFLYVPGGRSLQHLRIRRPALRQHPAHGPGNR